MTKGIGRGLPQPIPFLHGRIRWSGPGRTPPQIRRSGHVQEPAWNERDSTLAFAERLDSRRKSTQGRTAARPSYDYSMRVTFTALGPLGPSSTSKLTFSPSDNVLNPSPPMDE